MSNTGVTTTDISDELGDNAQVVEPGFNDFGKRRRFSGRISTASCPDDNSQVRAALESPGEDRVLVVDGNASSNCAFLGDQLAALACKNGWSGVVVNGCIRDSEILATIGIGVKALGTHPKKSLKRGLGERDIPVRFAGVEFTPGDYLYADPDGIVVTGSPVS
jgi:regulator of ribonuclease activity A